MLSHDLICDAAEQVITARVQAVSVSWIQRKARVGFATGGQLLDALTDIGVIGEPSSDMPAWSRRVLATEYDREAVLAATHQAVAAGRFDLHDDPCKDCPTSGETAWILRSPCGCAHGASLIDMTIGEAWAELAGERATAIAKRGWTLTAEPRDDVLRAVRESFGRCTHPEGGPTRG